jgi:Domain of unknown function (DUF1995)
MVFPGVTSNAFVSPSPPSRLVQPSPSQHTTRTSLGIGNLLGMNNDNTNKQSNVALPRDVKDAVSKCRAAVQLALQNKCSRMDIEMPVGTKFGVEKTSNNKAKKKQTSDNNSAAALTRAMLDQSDRELARLFVEMFLPVGGDNIAVIFNDAELADSAKLQWKGDYGAECRVLAVDRKKKKGSQATTKKKAMGFAAKLAAEVQDDDDETSGGGGPFALPGNIEVALFVAPGPKELIQVEKICSAVGMGTLVILLNARLGAITNNNNYGSEKAQTLFQDEFETVFALTAAPQQEAPNCLLYRSYPNPWVLARKPKVGPPKPIPLPKPSSTSRPTPDECQTAYNSLQLGEIEKGIENVLENVAGWFN